MNVQNSVGEREKQIILKNQPPPIEVHLKNEEPDLMTVIATTVFLHTTATRSTTTVTTITAGTASTAAVTIAIVTSIKRLSNSFFTALLLSLPMFESKISLLYLVVYSFYIMLYETNSAS